MRSLIVVSGWRAPRVDPVPRQRDVDRLLGEDPGVALGLEHRLALLESVLDRGLGLVDPAASVGLGLRGQRADLPAGQRHRRLVAQVRRAQGRELIKVGCLTKGGFGLFHRRLQGLRRESRDLFRVVRVVGCRHVLEQLLGVAFDEEN